MYDGVGNILNIHESFSKVGSIGLQSTRASLEGGGKFCCSITYRDEKSNSQKCDALW